MALTAQNIKELNNMNEAAHRAELGNLLARLESASPVGASELMAISAANPKDAGIVKQAVKQENSTASDVQTLVNDFNNLLSALKSAGIMAK